MQSHFTADIESTVALAINARQQHVALAGGTAVIWAEASNGVVVCITNGDYHGEPFTDRNGKVECNTFAIGAYRSVKQYEDGEMYDSLDFVPADATFDALIAKVKELVGPLN